MPRKAGHNQPNFILGARRAGPNPEGHFTSALTISNYNVDSAGHARRRKGLVKGQAITNLGSRTIIAVEPFDGTHLFLLSDGRLYITESFIELPVRPFAVSRYLRSTYAAANSTAISIPLDFTNELTDLASDGLPVGINDIFKIEKAGDLIWIFSKQHFTPFILEIVANRLEVYPIYLQSRDTKDLYPFLRSIPLRPDKIFHANLDESDLDNTRNIKLFIDKNSDLNTNKCAAWLGYDLTSVPTNLRVIPENVGLKPFLHKPLFFNILPTEAVSIDPESGYDSGDDFTGAVLTGLNTATGLADFSSSAIFKRKFMQELLFGRKYCIIPYKIIDTLGSDLTEQTAYNNVFEMTAATQPKRQARFKLAALSGPESVSTELPEDTTLNLSSKELTTEDEFTDNQKKLEGQLSFSLPNIHGWSSRITWEGNSYYWAFGLNFNPANTQVLVDNIASDLFTVNRFNILYRMQWTISSRVSGAPNVSFLGRTYALSRSAETRAFNTAFQRWVLGKSLSQVIQFLRTGTNNTFRILSATHNTYVDTFKITHFNFTIGSNIIRSSGNTIAARINRHDIFTRLTRTDNNNDTETFTTADETSYLAVSDYLDRQFNIPFQLYDVDNILPASYTDDKIIIPVTGGEPEGFRSFGWAHDTPTSKLTAKFTDAEGTDQEVNAASFFKPATLFRELRAIKFVRDYTNSNYRAELAFAKPVNISSLTAIVLGSVTEAVNFGMPKIANNLQVYSAPIDSRLYDLAFKQDEGTETSKVISFTGLTPEYDTLSINYDPVFGWSRGSYRLEAGLPGPLLLEEAKGEAITALSDSQGLAAFGFHIIKVDDEIKYTPFMLININSALASSTDAALTIGGTSYDMKKVQNDYSDAIVEFQTNPSTDSYLDTLPDLSNPFTVEIVFETGSGMVHYEFVAGTAAELTSKVKAECFIFELGVLSSDLRVAGKRLIGGNNYDNTHAKATRIIEGSLDGIEQAALVGSEDAWIASNNALTRMSKDIRLYSNNFIQVLNNQSSQEFIDTFVLSGIKLTDLADNFFSPEGSDLQILQAFIKAKSITTVEDNPSYSAVKAYLSGTHLRSVQRVYSALLTDPSGGDLTVNEMQADFHNTSVFIATKRGIFNLGGQALVPNLISRQVAKSNLVSLNNKLVFLNTENVLTSLLYSDERRSFVERKDGKYQADFYHGGVKLVFNPFEDAFYCISNLPDWDRYGQDKFIMRAINIDDFVAGFSSYSFVEKPIREPSEGSEAEAPEEPYLIPRFLFINDNMELTCIARINGENVLTQFSSEQAADLTDIEWASVVVSNPLIYNNLAGLEGALALINVSKVAVFEDGDGDYFIGSGTSYSAGGFQQFPPRDNMANRLFDEDIPLHSLEGRASYRESLIVFQKGKDNQGVLKGFQALANVDPGGDR